MGNSVFDCSDWRYFTPTRLAKENKAESRVDMSRRRVQNVVEIPGDKYASERASPVATLRCGARRFIATSIEATVRPRADRLCQSLVKARPQRIGLLPQAESTDCRSIAFDVFFR